MPITVRLHKHSSYFDVAPLHVRLVLQSMTSGLPERAWHDWYRTVRDMLLAGF